MKAKQLLIAFVAMFISLSVVNAQTPANQQNKKTEKTCVDKQCKGKTDCKKDSTMSCKGKNGMANKSECKNATTETCKGKMAAKKGECKNDSAACGKSKMTAQNGECKKDGKCCSGKDTNAKKSASKK